MDVQLWGNLVPEIRIDTIEDFGIKYSYIGPLIKDNVTWIGTNINSTIHYKMTEDVIKAEVLWETKKNEIREEGRETIPNFNIENTNEYTLQL